MLGKTVLARCLIILIVLAVWLPTSGFSKELENIPSSITTPQALSNWLSTEFTYRTEFPDRWQTPQETLSSKEGDCEDFAALVSAFLDQSKTPNNIVVVRFRQLKTGHAICAWRTGSGYYNFISGRQIYRTDKKCVEEAVEEYYPDWEKIVFLDSENTCKKTLVRK